MLDIVKKFIDSIDVEKQKVDIRTLFEYFFNRDYKLLYIFIAACSIIVLIIGSGIIIDKIKKYKNKDSENSLTVNKEESLILNHKVMNFFGIYVIMILVIIWNPICIGTLQEMINFGSMYRLYYMIPWCLAIAVSGAIIVSKIKWPFVKLLAVCIVSFSIAHYGTTFWNEWTVSKTNNWYKVNDEAVAIADVIMADDKYDIEEKSAMVPYGISSQIQQVHSEIRLLYTRIIWNKPDENGNPSPMDTDDATDYPSVKALREGDVKKILEYANYDKINYIAIAKETVLSEDLEDYNFSLISETNGHYIYRRVK